MKYKYNLRSKAGDLFSYLGKTVDISTLDRILVILKQIEKAKRVEDSC